MALSERLRMILEVDADKAVKGFERTGRTADREMRKAETSIDRVASGMTKAGTAMLAIGTASAIGLVKAAQKSSDLAEAVNLTQNVFGDASTEIDAFAENAATKLGQSERAAREATATFGGLLDNLGLAKGETVSWSQDLTTLASDLGSAFNTEPAQAVEALAAGLRGSSEPLQRYNVLLSESRVKQVAEDVFGLTGELSNQEKTMARLHIIMEDTSKVQGDFAATAEGAANAQRIAAAQWEDFQAQLGQAALPIMQDVLGVLNNLLEAFMSLPEPVRNAAAQVAVGVTAFNLIGGAALTAGGNILKMVDHLPGLISGLKRIGPAAGLAAVGLGLAFASYEAIVQTMGEGNRVFGDAADSILAMRDELDPAAAAAEFLNQKLESTGPIADMLRDAINGAGESVDSVGAAAAGSADEWGEMESSLMDAADAAGVNVYEQIVLRRALEDVRTGALEAEDAVRGNTAATTDSEHAAARAADGQFALATAQDDTARSSGGLTDAFIAQERATAAARREAALANVDVDELGTAYDILGIEILDAVSAFQRLVSPTLEAEAASDALQASYDRLGDSLATNGATLDNTTEKGRANRDALRDIVTATADVVAAHADQGASEDELQGILDESEQALRDAATEYGLTEDEVRDYIESVNAIPTSATTVVTLDATQAWNELLAYQRELAETAGLAGQIGNLGTPTSVQEERDRQAATGGRAFGGSVGPGQTVFVGERGIERLTVGRDAPPVRVDPVTGGQIVNVYVSGVSGHDVVRELRRYIDFHGKAGAGL